MLNRIITRFAPSPTGNLHVGGARTALFNYLYAKRGYNGRFLVRVDDTNIEEGYEDYKNDIFDNLLWMNLKWDGIVFQSRNKKRHIEVAKELLGKGLAYENDGCVRFRISSNVLEIEDAVMGKLKMEGKNIKDFVIVKSDGDPIYHLASVVDDHDMGITHIIRGNDHKDNSFKHKLIFEAMGWTPPVMAHIPLIHSQDGRKLSKRDKDGKYDVTHYKEKGITPEAFCNYIIRLGWSHGDDEVISREQMLDWFDFKGIRKSPSKFDEAKLEWLNKKWTKSSLWNIPYFFGKSSFTGR